MKIHLPQDQLLGNVQNILIAFAAISAIALAAIGRIRLYHRRISLQESEDNKRYIFSGIFISCPYITVYIDLYRYLVNAADPTIC